MIRALHTAATDMIGMQTQVDTTSNNIANAIGYKKQRVEFADLSYQAMQYARTSTSKTTIAPTGIELGFVVGPLAITKHFSQGNPKEIENNLDIAILGRGFFQIEMPDGTTAYARSGSFKLDNEEIS